MRDEREHRHRDLERPQEHEPRPDLKNTKKKLYKRYKKNLDVDAVWWRHPNLGPAAIERRTRPSVKKKRKMTVRLFMNSYGPTDI